MRQIKIGKKWTWQDYGLMLSPDPSIGAAEPKESYISIPYGNGSIDLTEALTGEVAYADRELEFGLVFPADASEWDQTRQQLVADCHGKKLPIIMPQYPDYYFVGRVKIGSVAKDNSVATLKVTVKSEPYMYKLDKTVMIKIVPATGELKLDLHNELMPALPTFTASAEVRIDFAGSSFNHSAGAFAYADVLLRPGHNPIAITAVPGTEVKIEYQEGAL